MHFKLMTLGIFLILTLSCSHKLKSPDLNLIYAKAAKESDLNRNPVIVIPGILGSKLYDQKSEHEIWGVFNNRYSSPSSPEKARSIALPIGLKNGWQFDRDSVVSTGALDRAKFKVLGVPIQARAYSAILQTLGVAGYRDEELGKSGAINYGSDHFTCFQFHYDWRRSNAENAARLDAFIIEKRKFVRAKMKEEFGIDKKDIKFDIVAHSMGGLVSRYYMRYGKQQLPKDGSLPNLTWSGAKNVGKVILVGTPNSGSVLAFQELLNGKNFAPKWLQSIAGTNLPSYPAGIVGTYPSMYELMPRARHNAFVNNAGDMVNVYDSALWEKYNWGLLNSSQDKFLQWLMPNTTDIKTRRSQAKKYLDRCLANAEQFHRALDRKASGMPKTASISLVVGDAIQTKERIKIFLQDGTFEDNNYTPGDGVVVRTSVLADERLGTKNSGRVRSPIPYSQVFFLPSDHLNLTKSSTFSDNILFMLLEK
ncbi:MAG: esterase/lipase family protein [Akkermansiaceae bacterium]